MNTPVADFVQRYAKAGTAGCTCPATRAAAFWAASPGTSRKSTGRTPSTRRRASWRRASKTPPPVRQPAHLLLHRGLQPVHPGHAVPGGSGQRLPHRGGGAECPPGLCLRRRSAGFGNPLAVAGGKPLFVRVPHLPRPAGGDLTQPARSLLRRYTSPARTIWAAWRKSPPWPRCATSTAPCCWWTTPMGLICGFCSPLSTPWIWAPICAAIPPTRPCRCSPAGHICTSPPPPRHSWRRWPSPPWGCLAPPAPLI